MILITTIWHTGTHSLMSHLNVEATMERGVEWQQDHCHETIFDRIPEASEIHTTYRDPYLVAISWANRDKLPGQRNDANDEWFEQWSTWTKVVSLAKVHNVEDFPAKLNHFEEKYGLRDAYDRKDWNHYFSHIPREWIDHAEKCTKTAFPYILRFLPVDAQGLQSVETRT